MLERLIHHPRFVPSLIVAVSLGALGTAWASEVWGGLQPCILCYYQRYTYMVAAAFGMAGSPSATGRWRAPLSSPWPARPFSAGRESPCSTSASNSTGGAEPRNATPPSSIRRPAPPSCANNFWRAPLRRATGCRGPCSESPWPATMPSSPSG
ncbi:MAG: disulfide bond formation protein B [Alphaproteobacteria bacterium]|nr:MAG: disulfide bond formation protein B [Alphaproteobacteria bacterium]